MFLVGISDVNGASKAPPGQRACPVRASGDGLLTKGELTSRVETELGVHRGASRLAPRRVSYVRALVANKTTVICAEKISADLDRRRVERV